MANSGRSGANEQTAAPSDLSSTLELNFIGVFEVPLKNVTCTSHVRQVNDLGCRTVQESIKSKGWLQHCSPAVVVEREAIEGGDFVEADASKYQYKVLDGNHRITAAKRLWGGERLVSCRVYYAFPDNVTRIIADRK